MQQPWEEEMLIKASDKRSRRRASHNILLRLSSSCSMLIAEGAEPLPCIHRPLSEATILLPHPNKPELCSNISLKERGLNKSKDTGCLRLSRSQARSNKHARWTLEERHGCTTVSKDHRREAISLAFGFEDNRETSLFAFR